MLDRPLFRAKSFVFSISSRSAARNSGVPGFATLSAAGIARSTCDIESHRCAPKIDGLLAYGGLYASKHAVVRFSEELTAGTKLTTVKRESIKIATATP